MGGAFVVLTEALMLGAAPLRPRLSLAADTLATALPVAPGVGTFDYFAAPGFAAYGAEPETAAALALTVYALWLPLAAVGLACYGCRQRSTTNLRRINRYDNGRKE